MFIASCCCFVICDVLFYFLVDVAVIDEIQMIQNPQRGWAWTRALLGVQAKEIHLCGELGALALIQNLLDSTNEELEVRCS